ncbi:MAG TPA: periplasmic heavy metal sensor [Stellaceae bacterium]
MIAATDGRASAAPRKPRALLVLLILSAALNLCFIGGALWLRTHEPPRTPIRPREFADELKLTPQQRTGFEQYFHLMRARAQLMRAELDPIISQAWAEIAKPQPDQKQIDQDFEQAASKRHAFAHDATQTTLTFLATLSPEQRQKFVTLLREHKAPWMHR